MPKDTTGLSVIAWIFSLRALCGTVLTAKTGNNNAVHVRVACKSGQYLLRHLGVGCNIGTSGVEHNVDCASYLACHDTLDSLPHAHAGKINTWFLIPTRPSERR